MSFQRITIVGNVGKDPELRHTQSGKAVANFSVAVNEGAKDKQETTWFNIVAWDKLAEICGEHVQKGKQVLVDGRLQLREYEDKSGNKRVSVEIVANTMRLLGGKQDAGEKREPGPRQTREAASPGPASEAPPLTDDDIPF